MIASFHSLESPTDEMNQICEDILSRTKKLISQLKFRSRKKATEISSSDLVHNITWSPVFPGILSLILGSIASIFVGISDKVGVVKEVHEWFQFLPTVHESIHPSLFEAMEALSTAKEGCNKTRNALLHCCFLLPTVKPTTRCFQVPKGQKCSVENSI